MSSVEAFSQPCIYHQLVDNYLSMWKIKMDITTFYFFTMHDWIFPPLSMHTFFKLSQLTQNYSWCTLLFLPLLQDVVLWPLLQTAWVLSKSLERRYLQNLCQVIKSSVCPQEHRSRRVRKESGKRVLWGAISHWVNVFWWRINTVSFTTQGTTVFFKMFKYLDLYAYT